MIEPGELLLAEPLDQRKHACVHDADAEVRVLLLDRAAALEVSAGRRLDPVCAGEHVVEEGEPHAGVEALRAPTGSVRTRSPKTSRPETFSTNTSFVLRGKGSIVPKSRSDGVTRSHGMPSPDSSAEKGATGSPSTGTWRVAVWVPTLVDVNPTVTVHSSPLASVFPAQVSAAMGNAAASGPLTAACPSVSGNSGSSLTMMTSWLDALAPTGVCGNATCAIAAGAPTNPAANTAAATATQVLKRPPMMRRV